MRLYMSLFVTVADTEALLAAFGAGCHDIRGHLLALMLISTIGK
jgi:hypothetical protein